MPQPVDTGQLPLLFSFERRIYAVSELNTAVQGLFEDNFRAIWVEGEISNCRPATSGHYYFSLKDAQSQLKCVLFRGAARFIKFRPQDGLRVLARGILMSMKRAANTNLSSNCSNPKAPALCNSLLSN